MPNGAKPQHACLIFGRTAILSRFFPYADKAELEQASSFLEQAAAANLPEFIKTLSDILRHGGNSPVARMAAGLQLKNQLTSKDPNIKLQYQQQWLSFSEEIRNYVKKNVSIRLHALSIIHFISRG